MNFSIQPPSVNIGGFADDLELLQEHNSLRLQTINFLQEVDPETRHDIVMAVLQQDVGPIVAGVQAELEQLQLQQ